MALRVAVLGLGEAGSEIARDLLRAGAVVVGYDPDGEKDVPGVVRAWGEAEAAKGADVVLSVNWARVALEVAQRVAPVLGPGRVYADLNTAGPGLKRRLAELLAPTGALFADVALMSPVPGKGIRTPSLAAGPGAWAYAEALGPLGAQVEVVGSEAGGAAVRKLLRSVFFKGMAAAVMEALAAARALGLEDELKANIAKTLAEADASLVERLVAGTLRHAQRRREEMLAAAELLEAIGVEPLLTRATAAHLARLAEKG
ncbi:NAD(P)-dependent oxidoreductase [Thermus igniterrae]|jgi:3-hydroxyisobutyrate dehydrogenase-like beta-hydroxyacid dehydrogenase|uniref:NAD(P)-dependent oxidoreductase n=1 Tax=Thermus igniterrae TaxID=88189 RepID=UPI00037B01C8|nr:NAD(P)-dependent oxidoreductase [Thermus igniterrae]